MLTVIIGRRSNLSKHLSTRLLNCRLVSAHEVLEDAHWTLPREPHRLVINSFQPAVALGNTSSPREYVDLSLGVTAKILSLLGSSGCEKLLYTSSASVYGANVSCAEGDHLYPSSLPAALKLSAELLVADVCSAAGVDYTILRLFNMYGGDDAFSVVARLLRAAREGSRMTVYNQGDAIRDFVHIDDVVTTYLAVLDGPSPEVLNVATGVAVSIRDLVGAVRATGVDLLLNSEVRAEIEASVADVRLLSRLVDVRSFRSVLDYLRVSDCGQVIDAAPQAN